MASYQDEEAKKEVKENKKQLTEFKKELDTIEQRFAFGKIPEKIYLKFSKELEQKIIELERKLSDNKYNSANQTEIAKLLVAKFQKLDKIWDAGTLSFKKRLQNLLFPNGMVVESGNKQLRTSGVSEFFKAMACFSGSYQQKNSGLSNIKFNKSALVAKKHTSSNQITFINDAYNLVNLYSDLKENGSLRP